MRQELHRAVDVPLRAALRQARHADLLNRVSVRHQLRPLSREQTCRYIDFQFGQAGGDAKVFDDSVKTAIHDFTGGVPGRSTTYPWPACCRPLPERSCASMKACSNMRLANFNCPNAGSTDMPRYFDDDFLRRLRNDISWGFLLEQLGWPHKQRRGQLAFLCPRCHEYLSAVNPARI